MGLKVTRTRSDWRVQLDNQPESSTLTSARYEHDALVGNASRPTIFVKVREFTDGSPELRDARVKPLFDYLWQKLETDRQSDVVFDFSFLTDVGPRFYAELAYLTRQIRHQGRSVRLSNVSPSMDGELPESSS